LVPDLGTTDGAIPIGDVVGMEDGVGTVVRDGVIAEGMAVDLRAENSTEATSFMGTVASMAVADITLEAASTAEVDSTVEVVSTAEGVGNASACSGKTGGRVDLSAVFSCLVVRLACCTGVLFLARMTSRKTAAVVE